MANRTGTAKSETFETTGDSVDRFEDILGGSDTYVVKRATGAAFHTGQVLIEDKGTGTDVLDLTDVLRGKGGDLGVSATGTDLADLRITSGGSEVILVGQLVAGSTSGVEIIRYNGKNFSAPDGTTPLPFEGFLKGIVDGEDRAPVALGAAILRLTEDSGPASLDLSGLVVDQDGDALSFELKGNGPANGQIATQGSILSFTPRVDADQDSTVTIVARSLQKSVELPVTIDIEPVNDAPRLDPFKVDLTPGRTNSIDLLADATDVEGDRITLVDVTPGRTTDIGEYQILQNRTLAFTPKEGASGSVQLSVVIEDDEGARTTSQLTLNLAKQNVAPAGNGQQALISVEEDGGARTLDLKEFITDANADPLNFVLIGNSDLGETKLSPEGVLTFTPAADKSGNDKLEFRVSDGALTFESDVVLQVTAANDGPVAEADTASLGADDDKVVIDVLVNDRDPENDKLTLTAVSSSDAKILANGRIEFGKPLPRSEGSETFSYTVEDGKGGSATGEVRVTIEAAAEPGAPDAREDAVATTSGRALVRGLKIDVLKNDFTPLGKKGLNRNSIDTVDAPEHGDVQLVKGKLVYRADSGFDGEDSFSYTVTDIQGRVSDIATVVITGPDLT